jgi:hypothetical protein
MQSRSGTPWLTGRHISASYSQFHCGLKIVYIPRLAIVNFRQPAFITQRPALGIQISRGVPQQLTQRAGVMTELGRGHGQRVPAGRDHTGMPQVCRERHCHKPVQLLAMLEKLLGRKRGTIAQHVVGKHEQPAKIRAEKLLPAGKAPQVIGRRPVLPISFYKTTSFFLIAI